MAHLRADHLLLRLGEARADDDLDVLGHAHAPSFVHRWAEKTTAWVSGGAGSAGIGGATPRSLYSGRSTFERSDHARIISVTVRASLSPMTSSPMVWAMSCRLARTMTSTRSSTVSGTCRNQMVVLKRWPMRRMRSSDWSSSAAV